MSGLNIAVTGGNGFIGTKVVSMLLDNGHTVFALRHEEKQKNLKQHERLFWTGPELFMQTLRTICFDSVIHLATSYGHQQPLSNIIKTNILLPIEIFEIANSGGCKTFINTDTFFSREGLDYQHMKPYIQSKKNAIKWLRLMTERDPEIRIINARLEHVYGPGDSTEKFVPMILSQMLAHETLHLTSGEQLRDFIYVKDVAEAYSALVDFHSEVASGLTEFGIGSGKVVSIRSFVEKAHAITKSKSQVNFGSLPYRNQEIMHSLADIRKITSLGWRPTVSLSAGIRATLHAILNK